MQVPQKTTASANIGPVQEKEMVPRRLEDLEPLCRYSVVYELTRIDYVLNSQFNFSATTCGA